MRKAPSAETYKFLYARSGNECAFPDCNHPIFNDKGQYIAELCHIKAANEGGERFDPNQHDENRRSIDNLLFLCHRHHVETNNVNEYSSDKLLEIKNNHESRFSEKGRELSNEMADQIIKESNFFWRIQKDKIFDIDDLKMKTNFEFTELELFNELINGIDLIYKYCETCSISDSNESLNEDLKDLFKKANLDFESLSKVPYYENPFIYRNWEYHNIGLPNLFTNLKLKLFQLRVKTIEHLLKTQPNDKELKKSLQSYRREFEDLYDNSYHVD